MELPGWESSWLLCSPHHGSAMSLAAAQLGFHYYFNSWILKIIINLFNISSSLFETLL
jgi:hypothetical protein